MAKTKKKKTVRKKSSGALTGKLLLFAKYYLISLNATDAYLKSGHKCSPETAAVNGSKLLRNTKVADYINARQLELCNKLDLTAERVLSEMCAIGFANMRNYVDFDNESITLQPMQTLSALQTAAIAEVSKRDHKEGTNISFKLHDKVAALIKLGEYVKVFNQKFEIPIGGSLENAVFGIPMFALPGTPVPVRT